MHFGSVNVPCSGHGLFIILHFSFEGHGQLSRANLSSVPVFNGAGQTHSSFIDFPSGAVGQPHDESNSAGHATESLRKFVHSV